MVVTYRWAQGVIAALVAATVGGCSSYGQQGGVVRSASLNRQVDVADAFITPPPGGPTVIAVLENAYQNALAQDVVLENTSSVPGQNVIIVKAYGPMGRDAGVDVLPSDRLDLTDIRKEMRERFPGVAMEVSGLYAQNRFGALAYATGRARSGATCLYAWQKIAPERKVFRMGSGSISWRLRVCDDDADARSLLLLAYGLTINGYFKSEWWNPYGPPPPVDPRIGQRGVEILPEQFVDPTIVAPTAFGEKRIAAPASTGRRAVRQPRSRQSARTAARPIVRNDPVEGAAVVPRPQDTDLSEPEVDNSNLPDRMERIGPSSFNRSSVPGIEPAAPLRIAGPAIVPSSASTAAPAGPPDAMAARPLRVAAPSIVPSPPHSMMAGHSEPDRVAPATRPPLRITPPSIGATPAATGEARTTSRAPAETPPLPIAAPRVASPPPPPPTTTTIETSGATADGAVSADRPPLPVGAPSPVPSLAGDTAAKADPADDAPAARIVGANVVPPPALTGRATAGRAVAPSPETAGAVSAEAGIGQADGLAADGERPRRPARRRQRRLTPRTTAAS